MKKDQHCNLFYTDFKRKLLLTLNFYLLFYVESFTGSNNDLIMLPYLIQPDKHILSIILNTTSSMGNSHSVIMFNLSLLKPNHLWSEMIFFCKCPGIFLF